jgi:hypothetical protein
MPYYKSTDNSLHFIDVDGFAHLLPAGCVKITDAEAEALRPKIDQKDIRRAEIIAQLADIDKRRIRPLAEGDQVFLASLNAEAVALRAELAAL